MYTYKYIYTYIKVYICKYVYIYTHFISVNSCEPIHKNHLWHGPSLLTPWQFGLTDIVRLLTQTAKSISSY